MKKIAIIAGTRPEAIKLAPLVQALNIAGDMRPVVCNTGQHEHMCGEALGYFGITADVKHDVMRPGQSLASLQGRLLTALDDFMEKFTPDAVVVQGDTMSACCGALAAFYRRLPIYHVEAGLRSHNLDEPFPEEALRQIIARIAQLHFAPTETARGALVAEGVNPDRIFVTGNTGIDALGCLTGAALTRAKERLEKLVDMSRPLALVTVHRRENHGQRLGQIMEAIRVISEGRQDVNFLLPVHPNPDVGTAVRNTLAGLKNVILAEPLSYPEMVCVMKHAILALSDSGGIQEEAPSFGLPVLVLRYETERREGIELGLATLVGADTDVIVREAQAALSLSTCKNTKVPNPYGDGQASIRIISHIRQSILRV